MRLSIRNWAARFQCAGPRRRKRRVQQLCACLAIGLATAWASPAEATVVHLEVTPAEDLIQAFVIYNNYVPNSSPGTALFALGDLTGGQTTVFDHEISYWTDQSVQYPSAGYMLFALHGAGDNRGLSLSFPDDSLLTSNGSWDSFIDSTYYGSNGGWYPEQRVVDTWSQNWAWTMSISFPDRIHLPFGATATMVNMSNAVNGGTAIATVVPEPASWTLLVAGAGAWLVLVRRRVG